MSLRRFALTLAASVSLAVAAHADPLFNTGVDGSATPRADGALDSHYTVSYGATPGSYTTLDAPTYAVNNDAIFPMDHYWIQSDSSSAWISPFGRASADPVVNGFYDYRTSFDVGPDSLVAITGQWAADNCGLDILINGVSTGNAMSCDGSSDYAPFHDWTPFSITSGFVAGTNTIDFVVENYAQESGNPTGLRVEMSDTLAHISGDPLPTPEPASLALIAAGIGGAFLRRRRAL